MAFINCPNCGETCLSYNNYCPQCGCLLEDAGGVFKALTLLRRLAETIYG